MLSGGYRMFLLTPTGLRHTLKIFRSIAHGLLQEGGHSTKPNPVWSQAFVEVFGGLGVGFV